MKCCDTQFELKHFKFPVNPENIWIKGKFKNMKDLDTIFLIYPTKWTSSCMNFENKLYKALVIKLHHMIY